MVFEPMEVFAVRTSKRRSVRGESRTESRTLRFSYLRSSRIYLAQLDSDYSLSVVRHFFTTIPLVWVAFTLYWLCYIVCSDLSLYFTNNRYHSRRRGSVLR